MREAIFKTIFMRGASDIPLRTWLRMLPVELYVGENLLEMFSNTASYNQEVVQPRIGNESNGWRRPLEDFIPATSFNRFARKIILELLEQKYIKHYKLVQLVTEESASDQDHGGQAESRYELNHGNLHLLTELKISYNTAWVIVNGSIDLSVFLATHDLIATLMSGALVEFVRRLKI